MRIGRTRFRFASAAILMLLGLVGFWVVAGGRTESAPAARHVVVISIDGMGSSFYMASPPGLRIPNILRLMKEGSFAEAVEGVYPTLTYPSHATLVTGRLPAEHGIYTNLSSRQAGKNPRDWFWFASAIKVPTLWDEARENHQTTASIAWPVTAGAPIDWDVPEIWDPEKGEVADLIYVAKFMNPLVGAELLGALSVPQHGVDIDTFKTRAATYLIKAHAPGLLLVHFTGLDEMEHARGPQSAQAAAVLEHLDADVGEIVAAVKQADLAASTNIFVISDHGFLTIQREIHPNILLVNAGLLTADEKGNLTGGKIATVSNGGSFFIYWPPAKGEGEDFRRQVDAALRPLRDQGLAWAVFDRQTLEKMGADPGAQMALEAPDGASFDSDGDGPLVREFSAPAGIHGGLPTRKGLESSFIAWGPGIKAGVDLHRIRMTRIAPTILRAMGIKDQSFGDDPPLRDILR